VIKEMPLNKKFKTTPSVAKPPQDTILGTDDPRDNNGNEVAKINVECRDVILDAATRSHIWHR
jgi:hypothetical protein